MNLIKFVTALILFFSISISSTYGQKYFTKNGEIKFFSETPLEKIEAYNNAVASVLDIESGKMEFAVLIKSFHFEKSLMQEHFNENYMESSKFPKATFKGVIQNLDEIDFSENGKYDVIVNGEMTIHGVTKELTTNGIIQVEEGQISATSDFSLKVEDYNISIPKVVRENIAKEIFTHVDLQYKALTQ